MRECSPEVYTWDQLLGQIWGLPSDSPSQQTELLNHRNSIRASGKMSLMALGRSGQAQRYVWSGDIISKINPTSHYREQLCKYFTYHPGFWKGPLS